MMRRLFLLLSVILIGWIAVLAGIMRFTDTAPAAVVVWPTKTFLRALPREATIIDVNGLAVTFANRPDLTRELYKAGAWLVLPAGLKGSLPLNEKQKRALAARRTR